jgi:aerobic-type carbon monoxide dehydrogenase small subunit (CoxS/CutS family)
MRIQLTIDGQACSHEVEPGVLLSELLKTDRAVWMEGRLVDASLMLAAQAHGRTVELKARVESVSLLENLLVPEPSRC